ncbi:MAG TPA: DUF4157 domain-containing protein [Cytophagaceae bacterium]
MNYISSQKSEDAFRRHQDLSKQGRSVSEITTDLFPVNNGLLGLSNNATSVAQRKEAENSSNGLSSTLPGDLKGKMENSFSTDFSDVKIHKDSSEAAQLEAQAFTRGNDIHFAPGTYNPASEKGQQLLAHEMTHVVQQRSNKVTPTTQLNGQAINDDPALEKEADVMGAKALKGEKNNLSAGKSSTSGAAVTQGYFIKKHKSKRFKIADDLSLAVKIGYPNHLLYAKPGMVATANSKLKAVGSGIELIETSTEETFTFDNKKEKLKKVLPKNTQNNTKGNKMKLWADCGKSNSVVVGGSSRKAIYKDGSTLEKTSSGSPSSMKAEIMQNWLNKKYSDVNTSTSTKSKIKSILDSAKVYDTEISKVLTDYSKAKTDTEKETLADKYHSLVDQKAEKLWEYYNSLPSSTRDSIDKELGINRYATPEIGQGYTTSSGGSPVAGYENNTWNFHWGGVVMESTDTKDKVVLENYAVGNASVENKKWEFAMYGTVKEGQTFHDIHSDTNQHGTSPTTMTIEKA